MRARSAGKREDRASLEMTPMIDIVFQLLVFFIMTFKIVVPEGDFNIRMPPDAPTQAPPEHMLPPVHLRLMAGTDGELTGVRMNDVPLSDIDQVHVKLLDLVGTQTGPGSVAADTQVELDCDYNLKYKWVMRAITAVSGYLTDDNPPQAVKLIDKIKFSSPKKPG